MNSTTAAIGTELRQKTDLLFGYRRMANVLAVVLSERSLDAVLASIAEALHALVGCDDVVVWEASGSEMSPLYAEGVDGEAIRQLRIEFGQGLTGIAAATGEPIWVNDAHLDPRAQLVPGTEREPEAIICVPLQVRDQLLGVLSLYRTGSQSGFDPEEFELSRHFADLAAIAIDNARTRSELERLATTDELTGIANRRCFYSELAYTLTAAERYGHPVSLILLDLDRFKDVNDRFGHKVGDDTLRTIAALLTEELRRSDLAARIGGDEFAIILPETPKQRAFEAAQRIRNRIDDSPHLHGVRASIGIAATDSGTTNNSTHHQLLIEADQSLYQDKRARAPRVA